MFSNRFGIINSSKSRYCHSYQKYEHSIIDKNLFIFPPCQFGLWAIRRIGNVQLCGHTGFHQQDIRLVLMSHWNLLLPYFG